MEKRRSILMPKAWVGFFAVVLGIPFSIQAETKVLVEVDDQKITEADLERAAQNFTAAQRRNILKDSLAREQLVDQLIAQELLVREAKKKGLQKTSEFQEALEGFKQRYLAEKLIEEQVEEKLDEDAVRSFYQSNRHLFSTERVHALHILLSSKEEAKALLKKAKEDDADFQKLAEEHSNDFSADQNRGDLGLITRDQVPKEFGDAAFEASEGEIVGPVETEFGFHVIYVKERKPGKVLSFHDVEDRAKAALRNRLVKAFVGELKGKSEVKVHDR